MLDFNDAPAELPADHDVTRESIRADLVARLESVLATLFPAGKKRKVTLPAKTVVLNFVQNMIKELRNDKQASAWEIYS